MTPLATRVTTAALLVPVVLLALFALPPLGWAAFVVAVVGVGAAEWTKLAGFRAPWRSLFAGAVVLACLALLYVAPPVAGRGWPGAVLVTACGVATLFWLAVALPWVAKRWKPRSKLALALAGAIVLGGGFVALIELQSRSPWLVLAAMAIVWVADTAAYFAGRALGKRKLAPEVSPGKTWEGVYGGLAAVLLYAALLVPFARAAGYEGGNGPLAIAAWLAIALALAALSIVGDLYESWLKRVAGVKDSGRLLPGHGGILDRVDALLAAMPPAALAAHCFLKAA